MTLKTLKSDYWTDLAQATGLSYIPYQSSKRQVQHRLLGSIDGYITLVTYEKIQNSSVDIYVYTLLVRYADIDEEAAAQLQDVMAQNPYLRDLQKKIRYQQSVMSYARDTLDDQTNKDSTRFTSTAVLQMKKNGCLILLPSRPRKDDVAEIAERFNAFIDILRDHVRPRNTDACEANGCLSKGQQNAELILVDNAPVLLCPPCIAGVKTAGDERRKIYEATPTRLGIGIAAGCVASVAWAFLLVLLRYIVPDSVAMLLLDFLMALFLFAINHAAMERAGAKRTLASIIMSAVLAAAGIFLGEYLVLALPQIWQVISTDASLRNLVQALNVVEYRWEVTVITTLLGLIPVGLHGLSAFSASRKRFFNPVVEEFDLEL